MTAGPWGKLKPYMRRTMIHDWLGELGDKVHLAYPLKVKAIAESKITGSSYGDEV